MIKIDPDIVIEEQTVNVVQTNKEVKDTQKMIKNTHQVFINMDRDLNQEFIIKDIKTIKEQPLENECDLLKCPSCPMFFDRTHLLKDHMASAHNSVPTYVVQSMPIEPQLNSGLRCTNCNNFYANKYSLRKHLRKTKCRMMSEMTINKVISEQLTCGKCKKQFGSILALNKHVSANKCSKPPKKPKQDPVPNKVPLVYDESIQLGPNDKIEVFKCPLCSKPCVTLR